MMDHLIFFILINLSPIIPIGLGFIGLLVYTFAAFIPVYGTIAKPASVLLFCFAIFLQGMIYGAGVLDDVVHDLQQAKDKIAKIEKEGKQITHEVEIQYVDRVKTIKEKGDEIIKYVDRYITDEDNISCKLPNSFHSLLNHAADNKVPDPIQQINGATSITIEKNSSR
jgi:hypothetical protein